MDTAPVTAHLTRAGRATLGHSAQRLEEVRRSWRIILQATLAATLAYGAALALGHEQPFFAPIAAIATVAVSLAHRLRRSAELLLGNAVGILFADLLIAEIGTGVWQLGLVVAIALISAVMLGGGPILIMQASSAAVLIATLTPPTAAQPWNTGRVVDALVGGLVGLAVSALVMPVDPARHAQKVTLPVLGTIAAGYRGVAAALSARDPDEARVVLEGLRGTAPVLASFHAGLDATRESVRLSPWYWGQRQTLATYTLAGGHLDNALRNLRVLARQAAIALEREDLVPDSDPAGAAGPGRRRRRPGPCHCRGRRGRTRSRGHPRRGHDGRRGLRRGPVHRADGGPDPAVSLRPAAGNGHERGRGRLGDPRCGRFAGTSAHLSRDQWPGKASLTMRYPTFHETGRGSHRTVADGPGTTPAQRTQRPDGGCPSTAGRARDPSRRGAANPVPDERRGRDPGHRRRSDRRVPADPGQHRGRHGGARTWLTPSPTATRPPASRRARARAEWPSWAARTPASPPCSTPSPAPGGRSATTRGPASRSVPAAGPTQRSARSPSPISRVPTRWTPCPRMRP